MGYYVHLHVCMPCSDNEPVAVVARKHLAVMTLPHDNREAYWYLDDLAKRKGHNPGPKGGLSLWGIVGNCTRGNEFCEQLRPFWTDLFASDLDGGPHEFEHIIVFVEREETEQATAFEISYDIDTKAITIKEHACPFAWMQM